jgi:broad specificity phosphatase PhoE
MMRPPPFRLLTGKSCFYFVRHGESEANRKRVIQGHSDSPLSETGRQHARAAGEWLAIQHIDRIMTSPLSRSFETASIIASTAGTEPPVVLEDLKELDTGAYSGKSLRVARDEDPESFRSFLIHSWEAVPGAESKESLIARALRVWDRLIRESNAGHRHLVCVTHGGMLQWLIKATMVCDGQRWMPIFGTANCGISEFVAESTSLDHEGELPPHTGYFGSWEMINYVPYERAPGLPG